CDDEQHRDAAKTFDVATKRQTLLRPARRIVLCGHETPPQPVGAPLNRRFLRGRRFAGSGCRYRPGSDRWKRSTTPSSVSPAIVTYRWRSVTARSSFVLRSNRATSDSSNGLLMA